MAIAIRNAEVRRTLHACRAIVGSFSIAPFGLALVSVLWAYDGWADLAFISGEIKDPERNLPRALIYGTLAVIAIYILANIAYLGVMTVEEVGQSKLVAADVAFRLIGQPGVVLVAITVMLSTLGTLNGSILTNPRVFFAMAADGLLFRKARRAVHPRFYQTAVRGDCPDRGTRHHLRAAPYVRTARRHVRHGDPAVLRARCRVDLRLPEARHTILRSARRCILVAPILFMLAALYLLVNALIDESSRWPTLAIFGIIALGVPVYFATVGRAPRGGKQAARCLSPGSY